jgi:hypothetical protein
MKITMQEFAFRYDPCKEAREWAKSNCTSMRDAWDRAKPEWLVWIATREGVLTDQQLRRFACWCVRKVWHLLTDERSRHAVEVAERYADGHATKEELIEARASARAANSAANRAADAAASAAASAAYVAYVAADVKADEVADAAASAAARAAYAAADAAADAAAYAAAYEVASDEAAYEAHAEYLRALYNPFEECGPWKSPWKRMSE